MPTAKAVTRQAAWRHNPQEARGLSGALEELIRQPYGDVLSDYALTPGGDRVLYRADQDTDAVIELYSSAIAGPAPTRAGPIRRGNPFPTIVR